MDGAVRVHVQGAAGLQADIEPEAHGDPASLVRTRERRRVVRVVPDGLQHFLAADAPVLRAVGAARALLGGIAQPEIHGIQAKLGRDLVDHLFGGERSLRRAGSSVCRRAGLVDDYVVAIDREVGAVVGGEDAHAARRHERARVGAGLVRQRGLQRLDLAVRRGSHLDPDMRSGCRSCPGEDILARHDELDRTAGLARQQGRDRFHVDRDLAAKAAADLHRRDLDVRHRNLQDLRGHVAHDEGTLRGAPDVQAAVVVPKRCHVVRLDIALVDRGRVERPLDHHVRAREPLGNVARRPVEMLGDIGGLVRLLSELLHAKVGMQQYRVRGHRFRSGHVARQRLVVHHDGIGRLQGDMLIARRDRGHGMALVQHLAPGEDVPVDIGQPRVAFSHVD